MTNCPECNSKRVYTANTVELIYGDSGYPTACKNKGTKGHCECGHEWMIKEDGPDAA